MGSRLKLAMIGLDTSHCAAFANLLNNERDRNHVPGARVVKAFPGGTDKFQHSASRVPQFTRELGEKHGVRICGSIEEAMEGMDGFLLESVDGRQHLGQFRILAAAGKPVFIDKPMACSFADALAIAELAASRKVPILSASSCRFAAGMAGMVPEGAVVNSCEAYGPMSLLDDYPSYFWYGVHSVDVLYSHMGCGCLSVRAVHTDATDVLAGVWQDGRIGTVRGLRFKDAGFGCSVFTDRGMVQCASRGDPPAYAMLLRAVVPFLQTGAPPIPAAETLEVMAFLDAAHRSLNSGGAETRLNA